MNIAKIATLLRSAFGFVTVSRNSVNGGITKIWTGTQAEYDALTPANDTLYIIVS